MTRRQKPRRGVLLLIVLSLLVLFVMAGVTFIVVAGNYRKGAAQTSRLERNGDKPQKLVERAFYDILRDTNNRFSSVRFHSFLRDEYGEDGFGGAFADLDAQKRVNDYQDQNTDARISVGPVATSESITGNTFVDIAMNLEAPVRFEDGIIGTFYNSVTTAYDFPGLDPTAPIPATAVVPDVIKNLFSGRIVTITSGDYKGSVLRVVGFELDESNLPPPEPKIASLRVYPIRGPLREQIALTGFVELSKLADANYIMNGRQFNGRGFGWAGNSNSPAPQLNLANDGLELALTPNYRDVADATAGAAAYFSAIGGVNPLIPPVYVATGGSDEPYDAPDYQNMALSGVVPYLGDPNGFYIPSYHRPGLIHYWFHRLLTDSMTGTPFANLATDMQGFATWAEKVAAFENPEDATWTGATSRAAMIALKRRISLRPLKEDNPNFSGSNPFDPSTGVGFYSLPEFSQNMPSDPVVMPRWDVDNDGDGTPESVWVDFGMAPQSLPDGRLARPLFAVHCIDMDGRLNVNAHDRDESALFTPTTTTWAGNTNSNTFTARVKGMGYGPAEISLSSVFGTQRPRLFQARYADQRDNEVRPGKSRFDMFARLRFSGVPMRGIGGSFASPADLQGELAYGQDEYGNIMFETYAGGVIDSRRNSPYEIDLLHPNPEDRTISAAEMEILLRRMDADAEITSTSMPIRLARMNGLINTTIERNLITSHSFDVPVANGKTLVELILQRISEVTPTPADPNAVLQAMMLPKEAFMGLKLDLNSEFGNGWDDNMNGSVDEVVESLPAVNEKRISNAVVTDVSQDEPIIPNFLNARMNHMGGFGATLPPTMQRSLTARWLYIAMLAAQMDTAANFDPAANAADFDLARRVAQWAINTVDFRDSDSTMTPFEFDPNPFDGWNVDGILEGYHFQTATTPDDLAPNAPNYNVVWGCERPELLITETLAFHDRNTTLDPPSRPTDPHPFEQATPPTSGFYVELYSPWGSHHERPAEFYNHDDDGDGDTGSPPSPKTFQTAGIYLNELSDVGGSPVWRLTVTSGSQLNNDPDTATTNPERSVYFTDVTALSNFSTAPANDDLNKRFHADANWPAMPIQPGGYAVIGSAKNDQIPDPDNLADSIDIGTNPDPAKVRRITLNRDMTQSPVYNNEINGSPDPFRNAQRVVGVAIPFLAGATRSLSVSEPLTPYTTPANDPVDPAPLTQDGTIQDYKIVHLQRLADPRMPWNERTNPYRTIDSMPVHLTVFNGATTAADPTAAGGPPTRFVSLQRGDNSNKDMSNPSGNLWAQEPRDGNGQVPQPMPSSTINSPVVDGHVFDYNLKHSLGFLSRRYLSVADADSVTPTTGSWHRPAAPFSNLAWPDRPFVSEYELMQVPAFSSSELLKNYTNLPSAAPAYTAGGAQFGHLLPFFQPEGLNPVYGKFHRVFDFVHVPSRFAGTEVFLDPLRFNDPNFSNAHISGNAQYKRKAENVFADFSTPNNRISEFREPGLVNLNTIYHGSIWNAVIGVTPPIPNWIPDIDVLVTSRTGYVPNVVPPPTSPTYFANPFRSGGANRDVPIPELVGPADIQGSMLRAEVGNSTPLFDLNDDATVARSTRSSEFRYELLRRLGNLTTTKSNVYAIWITMGLFELEPAPGGASDIHPDGYRLGKEVGIDTGEVTRHRAFYMIDRSIPVTFQPGKNYNVDDCVLLRRFIE